MDAELKQLVDEVKRLEAENARLREACRKLMDAGPCDDCYELGCDTYCSCSCHREQEAAIEAAQTALARAERKDT